MQKWQNKRSKAQSASRDYLQALRRRSLPFLPQPFGRAPKTPLMSFLCLPIVPAIGLRAAPSESAFFSARNRHYSHIDRT